MKRTNIVGPQILRKIQLETLEELAKALKRTFGPNGSNTNLYKPNMFPIFTKDGLRTVREIKFDGEIENSIKANIDTQCQQQAKIVGDATTSIVLLSYYVFRELDKVYPADKAYDRQSIMNTFTSIIDNLCEKIKDNAQDANLDLIREICNISTNSKEDLVELIMEQYDKYGLDALIEVVASCNSKTEVYDFDGMMLFEGFKSGVYVNSEDNKCVINNPEIYFFDDPIDTPEMAKTFDVIFDHNIAEPIMCMQAKQAGGTPNKKWNTEYVPTVVICPHFSKDYSTSLKQIEEMMAQCPYDNKPPFLLITNITQVDRPAFDDMCTMTGGTHIGKFLDPNNKKYAEAVGKAVTKANFKEFAGKADMVEANFTSTKVYGPAAMFNEDGSYSNTYLNKLNELEAKWKEMSKDGAPITDTFNYKKRIDGLKGKMVQISYGGISAQDRDMDIDALDDAVLNARSAAQCGVGYGANFEALRAINELRKNTKEDDSDYNKILSVLDTAYHELGAALYITTVNGDEDKAQEIVDKSIEENKPFNIRTKEFDGKVVSSIETDICILKTISRILMLMFTSNQFILSDINFGTYPAEPEGSTV